MVATETVRKLATSLDDVKEEPHFEKTSFRIRKKIFATMDERKRQVTLKLSEMDQSLFSAFDQTIIYPVPNKWGKQGWTVVELDRVPEDTFKDAMEAAYSTVKAK